MDMFTRLSQNFGWSRTSTRHWTSSGTCLSYVVTGQKIHLMEDSRSPYDSAASKTTHEQWLLTLLVDDCRGSKTAQNVGILTNPIGEIPELNQPVKWNNRGICEHCSHDQFRCDGTKRRSLETKDVLIYTCYHTIHFWIRMVY